MFNKHLSHLISSHPHPHSHPPHLLVFAILCIYPTFYHQPTTCHSLRKNQDRNQPTTPAKLLSRVFQNTGQYKIQFQPAHFFNRYSNERIADEVNILSSSVLEGIEYIEHVCSAR